MIKECYQALAVLGLLYAAPFPVDASPEPFVTITVNQNGTSSIVVAESLQDGWLPKYPLRLRYNDLFQGETKRRGDFIVVFPESKAAGDPRIYGPFTHGSLTQTVGADGTILVATDSIVPQTLDPSAPIRLLHLDTLTMDDNWRLLTLRAPPPDPELLKTQVANEVSSLTEDDLAKHSSYEGSFIANHRNALAAFRMSYRVHIVDVERDRVMATVISSPADSTGFTFCFAGDSIFGIADYWLSMEAEEGRVTAFSALRVTSSGVEELCKFERLSGRVRSVFGTSEGMALAIVTDRPSVAYYVNCGDDTRRVPSEVPLDGRAQFLRYFWTDRFAVPHGHQVDYYRVTDEECSVEKTVQFPSVNFESATDVGIAMGAEVVLIQDRSSPRVNTAHFSDSRSNSEWESRYIVPTRDGGLVIREHEVDPATMAETFKLYRLE